MREISMAIRRIDEMSASFTIRLVDVLELEKDGYATSADGDGAGHRIGLATYPIFDETYREGLNRKIIEHFYLQEIGTETISLFILFLKRRMNEIMPYWNQIYESQKIEFDPLATYDLSTVRDETAEDISVRNSSTENTNDATSTSGATSSSGSVASTTPQTMLSGSKDYATNANRADSKSDTTGAQSGKTTGIGQDNNQVNTTGNTTSRTKGFQGSAANLLRAYRESLLNTDMLVIEQLEDLFMGIWNTHDELNPNLGVHNIMPRRGMFF